MEKNKVGFLDSKHYQRLLAAKSPTMRIIRFMIAESEDPDAPIVIINNGTGKHMHFYKDKMLPIGKLPFDYGNVYFASDLKEFYADFGDYMSEIRNRAYPDCDDKEFEEISERLCMEYEKQFVDVFVIKINL